MTFNLTTIKKIKPSHLTITKKSQINHASGTQAFLSNHTNSPNASYLPLTDPAKILNPGDKLELIAILSPGEAYRSMSCLKVRNLAGYEFFIHSENIPRFLSL